ncbi:non-homologous end-joining factor 1 [Aplysia californica]|uniref:Non-homologous end-joining factor 1 n=1 Tax=Aplysia californica TaxID=6500 RepID=A0ABM0JXK6_APLCA|nr:non-homologous end-joining factor 1 [Aplysia californica]
MAELNWRRRWKPDLCACSWRPLDVPSDDGNKYLIKAKFDNSSYEVIVTDLTSFWYEKLSGDALKKRVSKLNPSIEAPLTKILSHVETNLGAESKESKLTLTHKDDSVNIKMTSQLAGMPFSFVFHTVLNEEDMGKKHLALPLMAMVGELYRQQQELFKILATKDKEIDDYKSQGVKATRKHIETTPFDVLVFRNSMVTSKGFENEVKASGSQAFTSLGQELYREIATKQAWLNSGSDPQDDDVDNGVAMEGGETRSVGAPSVESWASRLPSSIAPRNVSPAKTSPGKSPPVSPASSKASSTDVTPVKDSELLRRQALERKLEQEEAKQHDKAKKKKKLKF